MSTIVASHRLTVLGAKAVYPCGETGHATNRGVTIFGNGRMRAVQSRFKKRKNDLGGQSDGTGRLWP